MLFRLVAFALLLVPAAAIQVAPAEAQAGPSIRVPPARGQGRPIPGRFIVTLTPLQIGILFVSQAVGVFLALAVVAILFVPPAAAV